MAHGKYSESAEVLAALRLTEYLSDSWNEFRGFKSLADLQQRFNGMEDAASYQGHRSAVWKASLVFHNADYSRWPSLLSDSRHTYTSLHDRFLPATDDFAESDSSFADPLTDSGDVSPPT